MATISISEERLSELGEEFVRRLRRGERPSISDFTGGYPPEQAAEIRDFLESIAMLEDLKRDDDADVEAKESAAIPENFGRYRIERTLGEGGMGTVYLAHDSQLNRKVALKTPKFAEDADSTPIERFYREARSAATLRHPNICPVYDVGELEGTHYISMAYIEGHPLSDYIDSQNLPAIAAAVRVVRKVAIALHEAHRQGIVHRDLKPANIMIDRHNEPIVMDFGLARLVGLENEEELDMPSSANLASSDIARVTARLTQDGTILGSPGYMAPEQIHRRGDVGPASDVRALGVLLYELLTGELPFPGDGSLITILTAVASDDPPDASKIRRDIDPHLAAICSKAMAKSPEDRYESMQAFAVALTDFLKARIDSTASSAIPEVDANESASMVRVKEQCELVRSLYHQGQYTAALSILEKMVDDTETQPNKYIEWAESELPKVKAKAQGSSSGVVAPPRVGEDDFWKQDFGTAAAPVGTPTHTSMLQTRSDSERSDSIPRWFYAVVSVPIVVVSLLLAAIIASSFSDDDARDNGADDPSVAKPTTDSTPAEQVAQPNDPASATPANGLNVDGRQSGSTSATDETGSAVDLEKPDREPMPGRFGDGSNLRHRLQQFDSDNDGKLSKEEMARAERLPEPARRVLDNFDDYDRNPRDGFLDADELTRAIWEHAKPFGREKRKRGGFGPPRH